MLRAVPQSTSAHIAATCPSTPTASRARRQVGRRRSALFLLLRGFSSGAVALTGVEAISNGVPAFRKPESKNAATTLRGWRRSSGRSSSALGPRPPPPPVPDATTRRCSRRCPGSSSATGRLYWVLQFATAAILILAANTAYADFPRLSSIIARDGYLPRQFANRGDRLVFSNGVIFLAVAASGLIVAFGGVTTALIPLYAVGVFTSFTLSQAGMVAPPPQAARSRAGGGAR